MPLSIGVLIIGSLYWEPNREAWRQERLRMDQAVGGHAPIRYGRKSGKRGDTYTMVFSNCAMGQAKAVPCRNGVATAADLVAEAEELWAAEDNKEQPEGLIGKNWGCVTLLVSPACDIPPEILDGWAERVSRQPRYGNIEQAPCEDVLVGERGILQIAWPTLVRDHSPLLVDLLLATATRPTLTGAPPFYPTPEIIADAWRNDTQDDVRYFRNNVTNGIRTFEDDAIRRRLDDGCWIARAVRSFTRWPAGTRRGTTAAIWTNSRCNHGFWERRRCLRTIPACFILMQKKCSEIPAKAARARWAKRRNKRADHSTQSHLCVTGDTDQNCHAGLL